MKNRSSRLAALAMSASFVLPARTAGAGGENADWPNFGGDRADSKYSPLDQINASNFGRLKVRWTWTSVDTELENLPSHAKPGPFKPLARHSILKPASSTFRRTRAR